LDETKVDGGKDAGAMLRMSELTEREAAFVQAFLKPGSPTFGNKTKAAEEAGYASPRDAGWKAAQRPRVREAIAALAEAQRPTLDACMLMIEHLRLKAEEAGDLSTALRAAELLAKRAGAFVERLMVGVDQEEARRVYDEEEVEEARRLARLLLEDDRGRKRPTLAAPRSAVMKGVLESKGDGND